MATLENRVALVTGASRGIGAEIAKHLAAAGAKVVVNYVGNKDAADETVEAIKAAGGDALAVQADVSKSAEVKQLFDEAIAHYGRVDILVNNAAIILYRLIKETTDEEFDKLIDINIKGTFYALREAVTRLSDNGTIINFSSTTTRVAMPTYGPYVATKGAVEQLSRIATKELGARGINVNVVSPGPTNTELFMTGKSEEVIQRIASLSAFNRIGEPAEIAKLVTWLCTDEAKWVNMQNIGANGGMA